MLGAAALARTPTGVSRLSRVRPRWPWPKVVTDSLREGGLWPYLEKLGYHLVGYGCTTCIGNSGPRPEISAGSTRVTSRSSPCCRQPELRGRIAGRQDELPGQPAAGDSPRASRHDGLRLRGPAAGHQPDSTEVYLRDIWPVTARTSDPRSTARDHRGDVHQGLRRRLRGRRALALAAPPEGKAVRVGPGVDLRPQAPYFEGMAPDPSPVVDVSGGAGKARRLGHHGPHLPAGSIKADTRPGLVPSMAWRSATSTLRVAARNHEVMIRGTFANIGCATSSWTASLAGTPATSPTARAGRSSTTPRRTRRGRHPAGRAGRQGVRLGVVARLGGEGTALLGVRR